MNATDINSDSIVAYFSYFKRKNNRFISTYPACMYVHICLYQHYQALNYVIDFHEIRYEYNTFDKNSLFVLLKPLSCTMRTLRHRKLRKWVQLKYRSEWEEKVSNFVHSLNWQFYRIIWRLFSNCWWYEDCGLMDCDDV
jgi:hypothetical protein